MSNEWRTWSGDAPTGRYMAVKRPEWDGYYVLDWSKHDAHMQKIMMSGVFLWKDYKPPIFERFMRLFTS